MGEYAFYNGTQIKIGTCNEMLYLRYEDRHKVKPIVNNVDPATEYDLIFRLPYPDEDHLGPGNYDDPFRGIPLDGQFASEGLEPGITQATTPFGILINLPCYHGLQLPEIQDCKTFWNGWRDHLHLSGVRNTRTGLLPMIRCDACREVWTFRDWSIMDHVHNKELSLRIMRQAAAEARD